MNILVIDNYDSFVYNLVHMIRELGYDPDIYRNDKITLEEVDAYTHILLSPGPGIPEEAGILLEIIKAYAPTKSMLGVCLGHQAIGEAFGSRLLNLPEVLHGVASKTQLLVDDDPLFEGLPPNYRVAHYHSWVVKEENLSPDLQITGKDPRGHIMSLRHRQYKVWGLQYHPESVLTEGGLLLLKNWLSTD